MWTVAEDGAGWVVSGPGVALVVRVVGSTCWAWWVTAGGVRIGIVRAGLA